MKIIEEKKGTKIFLENHDILEVATMDEKHKMIIKCLGETFHIEEVNSTELEFQDEEKKAIEAMDKYLEEHKND